MLEKILNLVSSDTSSILTLTFFAAVIVIYSVFVFYFYRFLARKNIIKLNLNQYNQYSNRVAVKLFAVVLYILEYIILLPIFTFFWFAILAILTLILAKGITVSTILLISAALVAAVRVTSYVSEDLAKDLAKMLPFTLLAIAITTAGFFSIESLLQRISEIPTLFSNIPYYLLFIVTIELIMRIADLLYSLIQSTQVTEEETETETK